MNDLKLIDPGKLKRSLALFFCSVVLMFTACKSGKQSASIALADSTSSALPLPGTYVTTNESNKREDWFNNNKLIVIDRFTINGAGTLRKNMDFKDLDAAIVFFELLLKSNGKDTTTGVRVYFASPIIQPDKCGPLTVIFTATSGVDTVDVANYYAFKDGDLDLNKLDVKTAEDWVRNYQSKIRPALSKETMDINDTCKEETKHIWFSKKQISEIIREMVYQKKTHAQIVEGFGVRFMSYTDQDYLSINSKLIKYHKRMTVGFTFIDWQKEDIGIKQINAAEFKERFGSTEKRSGFRGDTFDTGVPAPPPPGNESMEALDIP